MEKTIQFQQNAGVFTVNGKRLGQLERVVLDPATKLITHIVVSYGSLMEKDQRVVPIALVAETTENQIALRSEAAELDDLPAFETPHYVPRTEQPPEPPGPAPVALKPPYGAPMIAVPLPLDPVPDEVVVTQIDRNIPEGTVAMKEGARVITSDGKEAGEVERIVADSHIGQVTYFLISSGLIPAKRLIPVKWVTQISEDEVHLAVEEAGLEELDLVTD